MLEKTKYQRKPKKVLVIEEDDLKSIIYMVSKSIINAKQKLNIKRLNKLEKIKNLLEKNLNRLA